MQTGCLSRFLQNYRLVCHIVFQRSCRKIHTKSLSLFPANVNRCPGCSCSSFSFVNANLSMTSQKKNYGPTGNWCSLNLISRVQRLHTTGGCEHKADGPQSLETEEDLSRLAGEVLGRARQREVMVGAVAQQQAEQLILGLHHCGFPPSHIATLLSSTPLLLLHHRRLLPMVQQMLGHGLDLWQVEAVLQGFPGMVTVAKSQVDATVEVLRSGRFHECNIANILAGNPPVMMTSTSALKQRLAALRQLFKSADVIAVVTACPVVLTEPWEEVEAKFDYVFHEMKVTQRQMVYATVFAHPLSHIKQRHAFLVRAGLFSMAKRREGERSPNARLDQIIASSEQAFCRRFGGFEVAEYRAFCELFDKEKAASRDSDLDSDEDE